MEWKDNLTGNIQLDRDTQLARGPALLLGYAERNGLDRQALMRRMPDGAGSGRPALL